MTALAVALVAVLLGACGTSTDGAPATSTATPSSSATSPAARSSITTTRPSSSPTSGPSTSTSTSTSATPAAGTPCPGTVATTIVTCLNASLSAYWTTTLGTTVRFTAVADPTRAQVPSDCRSGLALRSAFTCPADGNVYVTAPFLKGLAAVAPASDLPFRLASTMSHEAGHVVQLVERYPPIVSGKGDASSRNVEQQADCLSGVWAHAQGIPDADFLRGAKVVLDYVDSAFERRTHGTVAVRLAQIRRGLAGHTPQSCGLTVR